jgi:hypothetical protein
VVRAPEIDRTFAGLRTVTDEHSEKACDLAIIRKYPRTALRLVDAFLTGLDGVLACWALRKSKCHRFVTDAVDREANRMEEEQGEGGGALSSCGCRAPPPPVGGTGVADMAAVGALEDGDGG